MRNIEEIAAEEEARIQVIAKARLQTFLFITAVGLSFWGWFLFYQGFMGKGSLAVFGSLILFGCRWSLVRSSRFSLSFFFLGLLGAGPPLALFEFSRLPGFYWGKDPSFWLSVHAGSVGEPPWSPLSYLLAQAVCFLIPQRQFAILPELSGIVACLALFFFTAGVVGGLKNKNMVNVGLAVIIVWLAAVALPTWNAATVASGITSSLGLLLFVFLKYLLELEEPAEKAPAFVLGLLFSVHPLWGLLGLAKILGSEASRRGNGLKNFPTFLLGLTPFAWIFLRAGKFFPSWGGGEPFRELLKNWRSGLLSSLEMRENIGMAFAAWGWVTAFLAGVLFLLAVLYFFKWKTGSKSSYPALDFWVWLLAAAGGTLFYSRTTGMLGPTAVLIPLGLGEMVLKLLERGVEKRQDAFFSGTRLMAVTGAFVLAAFGLTGMPDQRCFRSQFFFPQQHAVNLLKILSPDLAGKQAGMSPAGPRGEAGEAKKVLVCEGDFEAAACLETRLIEPVSLSAVILEKRWLNQKWYLSQVISREPGLLFSGFSSSTEDVFQNLLSNNKDHWDVHWSVSALPPEWKEPLSFPTVLTREFTAAAPGKSMENFQYRLDLSALPRPEELGDSQTKQYFFRYVVGFNELGKNLMDSGLYLASIHAFNRVLKLDPSFAEPQSLLSKMYSQQKILEAARLEFEKTIKANPVRLGKLMEDLEKAQKEKDEVKSVGVLDEMIRLNSELADAQYQLSVILNREGRTVESKALLESSVRLNPKQIEAQLTMGRLMVRMGSRIKAEEAFRSVLGINPENKEAQVELWKLLNN